MQFWCSIHKTNAHSEHWHRFAYRRSWLCQQRLLGRSRDDMLKESQSFERLLAQFANSVSREST